mgnify:CR=1 FL=1
MGFKTLAIEQRSQEVWDTLRAVKSEFIKFGDMLDKAQKQLSMGKNSGTSPLPGSFIANSTRLPFAISTFISY